MTTNAKTWYDRQITAVTLPSGNTARLRQVDLFDLMVQGNIPDSLTGLVAQQLRMNKGQPEQLSEAGPINTMKGYGELLEVTALAAFVEPQLVKAEADEDLDSNKLWVGRLSVADKNAVFNWANGKAKHIEPFRAEPAAVMGDAQPGEDVPPAAVEPDGANGLGSLPV